MTELENNIEMIIKTLGGPSAANKQGSESTQSGQSSESSQGSQSSPQGQSQPQGSQNSPQGQQQSQTSGSSQPDPVAKINPIIDKMHYQWNNLMPAVIKKGASKELVNNFDNALNHLSSTVPGRNTMNTLLAANQLYAYVPDLYSLFQSKPSPAIKRIRYYSRSAILNSLTANWTQADSDMNNLKSVWALYKNSLSKDQQEIANKLDLSIYELEKVVKEKNQPLVKIKGNVELSNTETLEKAAESESGGQAGSQQSGSQQSGSQQSGSQ